MWYLIGTLIKAFIYLIALIVAGVVALCVMIGMLAVVAAGNIAAGTSWAWHKLTKETP